MKTDPLCYFAELPKPQVPSPKHYNSPVRRWPLALIAGFLCAAASSAAAQPAPARSIVYGGDQQFPPYEYLDEQGHPEGFNIHLIRALAREAGMSVEVRLGPREERMKEFDA